MEKGFIYIFKHENLKPVKIGYTSTESVMNRFEDFKIWSPSGGVIVSFFEVETPLVIEKKIHKEFESFRLNGEWFDLSEEQINYIKSKYDNSINKSIKLFNEWISNPENDIQKLNYFLKLSNNTDKEIKTAKFEKFKLEILEKFDFDDGFMTTTEICKHLNNTYGTKTVGSFIQKMGIERTQKRHIGYGFKIKLKCN